MLAAWRWLQQQVVAQERYLADVAIFSAIGSNITFMIQPSKAYKRSKHQFKNRYTYDGVHR
jgi:hypothetical protein